MAEKSEISYDMILSAKKGNMAAMGFILESFSPDVEDKLRTVAPWLSEEELKDCRQEVLISLIRIVTKFRLKY